MPSQGVVVPTFVHWSGEQHGTFGEHCWPDALQAPVDRQTPVVASAVGGIVEVVEDGKTGVLVPPARPDLLAQALARILGNAELGRRMGKAGRARVEATFSWASVAARTEQVYAEAIADFKRAAD